MGQISYLSKRGSVYYARLDVPEDLVLILKTQTRKASLKTKDLAEAKRLLWPIIAEWQREFESLRGRRSLVDADRQHAVWDHQVAVLARDDDRRSNLPRDAEVEAAKATLRERIEGGEITGTDPLAIMDAGLEFRAAQKAGELDAFARRIKLADMRKHLAKGQMALIADEVDEYLRANRLFVERSSSDWISLARHMMRAEIGPVPVSFRSGAHVKRPFVRKLRGISSRLLNACGGGCRSR